MLIEVLHPCVQHKMALLRDVETGCKQFRELTSEITTFVCYEALKHIEVKPVKVRTPLAETTGQKIAKELVVVPVLRAGAGMLDGILRLLPTARVGFVGLQRDERTKEPVEYYCKLPEVPVEEAQYLIVDPMLATGGSTVATLDLLHRHGVRQAVVLCLVTCPQGVAAVHTRYPDVPIYAAAVDPELDARKYIVPGLGDAGDRLYGTV